MTVSLVNPHCRSNSKNLAANADGAEAQDYVATGDGAAETLHGAEAGEQEHLIELMAQVDAVWAGNNLVADHLAVLVHGNINEQAVRKRELHVVLLGRPGRWIIGKGDQFRGTENIQRHVIGNGAHGDPWSDELQDQNKNEDGREKSAGSGNRKRAENIVEQKFRPIAQPACTAAEILGRKDLRSSYANAHS